MTPYEVVSCAARPFLLPLHNRVRREARAIVREYSLPPTVLDVGGRRSPYSIGLRAKVTISDVPRRTALQRDLDLGLGPSEISNVIRRRTNIERVILDDMTNTRVPADSVDIVLSVEVLEHVEDDAAFVANVARVLVPTGTFLLTTPNGDSVPNTNPDHKRHYTYVQLRDLLSARFETVHIAYAIRDSWWRTSGLRSWSLRHPVRTAITMLSNVVNSAESRLRRDDALRTCHLIATCRIPRCR